MAVSRALRRLLGIREIEEEQCRVALESALGELHLLKDALTANAERERRGRRLLESSAYTGELPDRLAGLEEIHAATRRKASLASKIADVEVDVTTLREDFLAKRVERRQAETMVRETEARDAAEAGRRSQQALDDWYGDRLHLGKVKQAAEKGRISGQTDEKQASEPKGHADSAGSIVGVETPTYQSRPTARTSSSTACKSVRSGFPSVGSGLPKPAVAEPADGESGAIQFEKKPR
jgi:hypothetical protein